MRITLRFCRTTVKLLTAAWQAALRRGDQRLIKRITALLLRADGHAVPVVAERVGAGESTVYAWLQAFLLDRFASLRYRRPPVCRSETSSGAFIACDASPRSTLRLLSHSRSSLMAR